MSTFRHPSFVVASAAIIGLAACGGLPGQGTGDQPFSWEDDFGDPSSGWPRRSNPGWIQDYEGGVYRVVVDHEEWNYALATATAGLEAADVIVEVDVRYASNYAEAKAGVICRYLDGDNYYYFAIEDAAVSIVRSFQDEQTILVDQAPTDAIDPGNSRLRAECIGDSLAFYVNGQAVASIRDDALARGDVGLIAGGAGSGLTDVRFDNFSARSP